MKGRYIAMAAIVNGEIYKVAVRPAPEKKIFHAVSSLRGVTSKDDVSFSIHYYFKGYELEQVR